MCYILFELSKHLLLFFPPRNNISEMTHLLSPGGGDFYPKAIWFPQVHELSTSDGLRNFLPSIVLRGWQTPLVSCKKLLVLPWSWLFHRSREEGLPPLELSCLRPGSSGGEGPGQKGHLLSTIWAGFLKLKGILLFLETPSDVHSPICRCSCARHWAGCCVYIILV